MSCSLVSDTWIIAQNCQTYSELTELANYLKVLLIRTFHKWISRSAQNCLWSVSLVKVRVPLQEGSWTMDQRWQPKRLLEVGYPFLEICSFMSHILLKLGFFSSLKMCESWSLTAQINYYTNKQNSSNSAMFTVKKC